MLSAAAVATRHIRLISSIATWTRTPLTTARAVRAVDLLSGGRYTLGLGSMPPHFNEDHHGIPYKAPMKRMAEYAELVRLLWEAAPGTPVSYEGSFYSVSGYRAVDAPPDHHIPILIGATRPRMTRMAGELADGVIFNSVHSVPWLQRVGVPALVEGAHRSGRTLQDLDKGVTIHTFITDEPEQGRAALRRSLAFYATLPYGQEWLASNGFEEEATAVSSSLAAGDRRGAVAAISDRVVDAMSVMGTPEECREQVAQYASSLDWVSLSPVQASSGEDPMAAARRIITTFGDKG